MPMSVLLAYVVAPHQVRKFTCSTLSTHPRSHKYKYMPVAPAAIPLPADASSIATVLPMALPLCLGRG